jgi:hypothetical protein
MVSVLPTAVIIINLSPLAPLIFAKSNIRPKPVEPFNI